MKLTFLGTGTSHGIPAIGCSCPVCTSSNPHNKRRRSSLYVESGDAHLVIDTPPDFRDQVLTFGVTRVDAVFITHIHADHIFGFDDLRRFCYMQKMVIPVYGSGATMDGMREKFRYVIDESIWRHSAPQVTFNDMSPRDRVQVGELEVQPVEVPHGPMTVYGYIIRHGAKKVGYVPDCSALESPVVEQFQAVDVMILDALREAPHPTHLCLPQAVDLLQQIGAPQSYITHVCHDLEHEETQARLPTGITVPYDGFQLTT